MSSFAKFVFCICIILYYLLMVLYSIALASKSNWILHIDIILNLLLIFKNILFTFLISQKSDEFIFEEDKIKIEQAEKGKIFHQYYNLKSFKRSIITLLSNIIPTIFTTVGIYQIINGYLISYINNLMQMNLENMNNSLPMILVILFMLVVINSISNHQVTFLFYMLEVCLAIYYLFSYFPNLNFSESSFLWILSLIIIPLSFILITPFLYMCYLIYDDNLNTELIYKGIQNKIKKELLDYSKSVFGQENIFTELFSTEVSVVKKEVDNIELLFHAIDRLKENDFFHRDLSWKIQEIMILKNRLKIFDISDRKIGDFLKRIIGMLSFIFSLSSLISLINEIHFFGKGIMIMGQKIHITNLVVYYLTLFCVCFFFLLCHMAMNYLNLSQKNNRLKEILNTIDIALDDIIIELKREGK